MVTSGVLAAAMLAAVPTPVRLSYERQLGAERCPEQTALETAVTARLGRSPFAEEAAESVQVVIAATRPGLVAKLTRFDAQGNVQGKRELGSSGVDCDELARAVELALVLAIDPQRALAVPVLPAPVPPPPAPHPSPAPAVAAPAASWKAVLGLGVRGSVGVSLGPTVGPSLVAGFARGWFELDVIGRADLATASVVSPGTLWTSTLLASLCPSVRGTYWGVGPLLSAGALRINGEGFTHDARQTVPVVTMGARAFAQLPLRAGFALRLELDGQAMLIRTTVTVDARPVWMTPPLSASVGLMVIWVGP